MPKMLAEGLKLKSLCVNKVSVLSKDEPARKYFLYANSYEAEAAAQLLKNG